MKRHRITIGPGTYGQRLSCSAPWECELPNGVIVPLEAGESYLVPNVEADYHQYTPAEVIAGLEALERRVNTGGQWQGELAWPGIAIRMIRRLSQ